MIDHVNIPVRDLARARAFYEVVLGPLGLSVLVEDGPVVGFGRETWMLGIEEMNVPFPALHLAFAAPGEAEVAAFHAAGLEAGARCNGHPGLRPAYGEGYFAAYLVDPDGHRIEAVHRG